MLALLASALLAAAPAGGARFDPAAMLESADLNKDGAVSREETLAQREKMFARLDANGDGYVTDADKQRRLRARKRASEQIEAIKTAADANGDGKLSREEFLASPTPFFDRADANGDGFVTKEELDIAKTALAAERP